MFLLQVAVYIFVFVFVLFLAQRALWLVFFLFNFRFWEVISNQFANELMDSLEPIQKFILLMIVSLMTYLSIHLTTIRFPLIRYIFLGLMFILAVRYYTFSEIFLFKDYFEEIGIWNMDFWVKQVRAVFTFTPDNVIGVFNDVLGKFVDLIVKLVEQIKQK